MSETTTAPAGSESQIGYGFEEANGIWQPSKLTNFLPKASYSGFTAQRTRTRSANMVTHGQQTPGVVTRVALAPKVDWEPNADDSARLIAHLAGKDPVITNLAVGVEQWEYEPWEIGDTAPTNHLKTLFFEASDNDGFPVLVSGVRMSEWAWKVASGAIHRCSMSFGATRDTYESDATEVLAASYTGVPIIRGHRREDIADVIKITVTAGAAGGSVGTIKAEVGATAHGTTAVTITEFNKWYPLVRSSDGTRMGISQREPLEICFPAGFGTLTATDEWTFTTPRDLATASYSTMDPLAAGAVQIVVAGETYDFMDADLKFNDPTAPRNSATTIYTKAHDKNGRLSPSLTVNRQREDRDFLLRSIRNTRFSTIFRMYGNPLGSTGYDELVEFTFPNCEVASVTRDVPGETVLTEKIDITPVRVGASPIWSAKVICTKADVM